MKSVGHRKSYLRSYMYQLKQWKLKVRGNSLINRSTARSNMESTPKPKQMHFQFHEIEVFCMCQMPETWDHMVRCDSCGEWYHLRCINLRSMLNSVEQWFCSACNLLYLLQFLFLLLFDSINVYDCDINDAVKHSQSHSTTKKNGI